MATTDLSAALVGQGAPLQPIADVENSVILNLHSEMVNAATQLGIPDVVTNLTALGKVIGLGHIGDPSHPDGHTNVLTDALNLPGNALNGNLDQSVDHISTDLIDVSDQTNDLVNAVLHGNDPLNPVPDLVSGVGSDLQNGALLTLNGGNNSGDGGLLGGIVGDLNHSNSGHLIDVDLGPESPGGQSLDVLAAPTDGNHHTLEINAVDVGANGPHLLDLGALTGNGILNIPTSGGGGTDLLSGILGTGLGLAHPEAPSGNCGCAPVDVSTLDHASILSPLTGDHGLLDTHGSHIL